MFFTKMTLLKIIHDWHYLWMGLGFLLSTFLASRVVDFNMSVANIIADYYGRNPSLVRIIFIVSALTLVANSSIWGFMLLGWGVLLAFILDLICEFTLLSFLIYKTPDLFDRIRDFLSPSDESEQ
jgi:phage shock protein PspC (stress-responsive transcriptional regulator)